jgi:hypothetical protein
MTSEHKTKDGNYYIYEWMDPWKYPTAEYYNKMRAEGTASVSPLGFLHKDVIAQDKEGRTTHRAFFDLGTMFVEEREPMTAMQFQDEMHWAKIPADDPRRVARQAERETPQPRVEMPRILTERKRPVPVTARPRNKRRRA